MVRILFIISFIGLSFLGKSQVQDKQIRSDSTNGAFLIMGTDTVSGSPTENLGMWYEGYGLIAGIIDSLDLAGGTQSLINSDDATTHTVTLSGGGGSLTLEEGLCISLSTSGTESDAIVTINNTGAADMGNSSDATSHSITMINCDSDLLFNLDFIEGTGITLTTTGTDESGILTIAAVDGSASNELENIYVDGVDQSTGAVILDFDGTDFALVESPADYFDITIQPERIQDIAGAMVTGNTETGITVTYEDSDGTFDFVATDASTTNEGQWVIDADGGSSEIVANQTILFDGTGTVTTSYDVSTNTLSIFGNGIVDDGDYGDITVSATGTLWNIDAGVVGTNEIATDGVDAAEIAANAVGSSEIASTTVVAGSYTLTNLTVDADGRLTAASTGTETAQDLVGAMVTGNTESNITVTYDDTDGTLDFVVGSGSADGNGIFDSANDGGTVPTDMDIVITDHIDFDLGQLYIDAASGEIGVNTQSPDAALNVESSSQIDVLIEDITGTFDLNLEGNQSVQSNVGTIRIYNNDSDVSGSPYLHSSITPNRSSGTTAGGNLSFEIGYNAAGNTDNVLVLGSRESGATDGYLSITGGLRYKWTDNTGTTSTTLNTGDFGHRMTQSGAKTVTLPALSTAVRGQFFMVFNDSSSGDITLTASGGNTFVGDPIVSPGELVRIDGISTTKWGITN